MSKTKIVVAVVSSILLNISCNNHQDKIDQSYISHQDEYRNIIGTSLSEFNKLPVRNLITEFFAALLQGVRCKSLLFYKAQLGVVVGGSQRFSRIHRQLAVGIGKSSNFVLF
ncbi:hypothetical protein [Parapedobacter tibetensis]|uniref:hypothetical protein n=1 Tax=Parapedobacter tibetensis TaxID=2972951 RepID=UPI00214D22FF|nr:hypothetical protein [Parapedobacter tibetensis]